MVESFLLFQLLVLVLETNHIDLYVALMQHGCTMEQFNSLMGTLVRLEAVEKRGELYFCTARGRSLVRGAIK
jgi:hypothetical protein